jgi:hypothetical protein
MGGPQLASFVGHKEIILKETAYCEILYRVTVLDGSLTLNLVCLE